MLAPVRRDAALPPAALAAARGRGPPRPPSRAAAARLRRASSSWSPSDYSSRRRHLATRRSSARSRAAVSSRRAALAPRAERHAVSLDDARALFSARFPPGSTKLDLRETSCGRGLVATARIAPGEVLVAVPWRETVRVFEDGHDDPDDVRLALELLRVLNEGGDGPDDPRVAVWRAYRPMLPSSTGAAAFWRPENIRALQHDDAVDRTADLAAAFRAHARRHADASACRTEADVLWALSMVHSRSFSAETSRGRARVLVPFVDLFNHRPESPAQARETDEALQRAFAEEARRVAEEEEVEGRPNSALRSSPFAHAAEPWRVVGEVEGKGDDEDGGDSTRDSTAWFQMRSIWGFEPGEEVFITYGHETSAELLASYGFVPEPNAGDFVALYRDVQDVLDDDRFTPNDSPALAMEKEQVMWSALAVEAPLAVRPGGVKDAAHLLGCLRVMHAGPRALAAVRDRDVREIGHSTFVWEDREEEDGGDRGGAGEEEGKKVEEEEEERRAVDAAALGHAAARCAEMLDAFPTTLREDEDALRELEAATEEGEEEGEEDVEGVEEYVAAVRYRMSVKRMLEDFVRECAEMGVEPTAW